MEQKMETNLNGMMFGQHLLDPRGPFTKLDAQVAPFPDDKSGQRVLIFQFPQTIHRKLVI